MLVCRFIDLTISSGLQCRVVFSFVNTNRRNIHTISVCYLHVRTEITTVVSHLWRSVTHAHNFKLNQTTSFPALPSSAWECCCVSELAPPVCAKRPWPQPCPWPSTEPPPDPPPQVRMWEEYEDSAAAEEWRHAPAPSVKHIRHRVNINQHKSMQVKL